MAAHFNGRSGTETLLWTSLLSWTSLAFLCQWVFRGEGFGSEYKPYFTWEMTKEFARCSVGIIRLFFVAFCPIVDLQRSILKLKIVGTTSFLRTSWQRLKEGSNKLVTTRFLFKAVFGKVFYTNARMVRGHSLQFHFFEPFSFKKV